MRRRYAGNAKSPLIGAVNATAPDYSRLPTDNSGGTTPAENRFGWVALGLLIGAIVVLAIVLPATLIKSPDNGSNVYLGLGDDGGYDNSRRAKNNKFLNSASVPHLQLKCKFDIAALEGRDYLEGIRIIGPLATLQGDEDRVYGFYGNQGPGNLNFDPADDISGIFAVNRHDCSLAWHVKALDASTQAAKMLLKKYPGEYNEQNVNAFTRAAGDHTCFGPIAVHGDFLFTGDGCPGIEFFKDSYYASLPQANGGPVLGKTWGVTNDNRHILHGNVYVFNKHTGELLAVDRTMDAGEAAAQGYVNPFAQTRMMTPFKDPRDGQTYVFTTTSHGARQGKWTRVDNDESRVATAILNNNREVRKGGMVKKFRLNPTGSGVELEEIWRYYGSPTMLFAGDVNPYPPHNTFATDDEAEQRNMHNDGIWSQRPMIDFKRRQVVIAGGNGLQMPAEIIKAIRTAPGTTDPGTGATGVPSRSYRDWYLMFNAATSAVELEEIHQAFVQTQKDSVAAALAVTGSRLEDFAANAIVAIDLDTGNRNWFFRRVASDTWYSLSLQAQFFSEVPLFNKFQYLGGGGDMDYGQGPIMITDPVTGDDFYMGLAKDGSVQRINPDTGAVVYDHKIMHSALDGGFNYQSTNDGRFLYAGTQYTRGLDFLADKNHDTRYNETSGEPYFAVIEKFPFRVTRAEVEKLTKGFTHGPAYKKFLAEMHKRIKAAEATKKSVATRMVEMPNIFANISCNWYTNEFRDTFNDRGGGAEKFYNNLNHQLEFGQGALVKIDAQTGKAITYAARTPASGPHLNGQALLTSANDVLFVSSQQGKFQAWNANNMTIIWEYDPSPDVTGLPDYPESLLVVSNPPIPLGKEVWATAGEFGFWGNYPGKYLYAFEIPH